MRDEIRAAVAKRACDGKPTSLHKQEKGEARRADRFQLVTEFVVFLFPFEGRFAASVQATDGADGRQAIVELVHNLCTPPHGGDEAANNVARVMQVNRST